MAGGGAANRLVYPSPIVFEALQQAAKSCLIMLHGLGDSGQGWADVAPMLQPDLPQTKFIFPTAPIRPITINGGMRMTGWYDIADLDRIGSESQDAAAMHESRRYIDELIEQEVAGGIPSESIVVGGFSQGGAMALMSLRSKHKLAGIVGLSCYLPLLEEKPIVSEENKDTPVLMCHGDCDQVVNYDFGKRSYEELQKEGVKVDFKTYQFMGHEACGEELMEMRDFLKACFSKAAGKL
ncbi:acyl- thioesterase 1 [Chlorella sorokiniana]|uniref:Acyl-thioesterase 1 n=1 Tax=Chlorella sorokiniana TaxID=3076 RepID=A0A2P6TGE4_CHLSO|nr:acyl- thioesterase 1 [Chlorella sorokiniana]|eukprot:PRW33175.1 acyl- thioesterase 1 [Chlorella sorokiniana]